MSGDDEDRLCAYLDGTLSPEAIQAFEAELEHNPELAARLADWRSNDAYLKQAFAPLADAPIDAATLARLGLDRPQAANDNPPWWRRRMLPLAGGAIAASLVAVALLVGQNSSRGDRAVSLALDTTASLHQARQADGRTIEPRLTVRAADGRWCREFSDGRTVALACREGGRWKVIGTAPQAPSGGGDSVLAGGQGPSPLDASYAAIGASDPLSAEAEAQLIAQQWPQR